MLRFFYRAVKRLERRSLFLFRYISWLGLRDALSFVWANRRIGRQITVSIPAVKTSLVLRGGTPDISVLEDTFLHGHYEFTLPQDPKLMIDAGAHVGFVSVLFANRYPDCKIIAIEPDVSNYELLCRNTEQYTNVTALNAALWFKQTTLEIVNPKDDNWAYRVAAGGDGEVVGVTLGELIKDFSLRQIDLLKLDIEGAEKEVLENSSPWINDVDAMVIELHDRFKSGCSRAFYDATQRFPCEVRSGPNIVVSMNELNERQIQP